MGHQERHYDDLFQALHQLRNVPEQVDIESQIPFDDPPPPYQSPTESTRPPSLFDGSGCDTLPSPIKYRQADLPSMPYEQFRSYCKRERDRLIYQWENMRNGRRQTLPFDTTTDLLANAENNVRAGWLNQAIWKNHWGPAWPKGAQLGENRWLSSDQNTGGPRPSGHWAHEITAGSIAVAERGSHEGLFGPAHVRDKHTNIEPSAQARSSGLAAASRPRAQFLYQVSKEREWIEDQIKFERCDPHENTEVLAICAVKDFWKEERIWDPRWTDLPGSTWMHEERLQNTCSDPDVSEHENEELSRIPTTVTPKHSGNPSITHEDENEYPSKQSEPTLSIAQRLRSSRVVSKELHPHKVKKRPPQSRKTSRRRNTAPSAKQSKSVQSRLRGEQVITNPIPRRSARIAALANKRKEQLQLIS